MERALSNMKQYLSPEDCCGCGACAAACPRKAITMEPDEFGFYYPNIEAALCVECGICKKTCDFQRERDIYTPQTVYAVTRKDAQALLKSASGGAFAVFAEAVLQNNGAVFGAVLKKEDSGLVPCHCMAESLAELSAMLGSKYVQSDLRDTFTQAKRQLENGRIVLFSGTPCQIGGLKSFLKKDYPNLLTIDLVCHGVPSASMFQDYLKILEGKLGGPITDFRFRDKTTGWDKTAVVKYQDRLGQTQEKLLPSFESSFYELFLQSELSRNSCYYCPYAGKQHPADITIGDFWGFELEHPEVLSPNGEMDPKQGVSLLMINTEKGDNWFERCQDEFICVPSELEKAVRHNAQLKYSSTPGDRTQILELYRSKGYGAVDAAFLREKKAVQRKEQIKYHLHNDIPKPVRDLVKKMLRRNQEG